MIEMNAKRLPFPFYIFKSVIHSKNSKIVILNIALNNVLVKCQVVT